LENQKPQRLSLPSVGLKIEAPRTPEPRNASIPITPLFDQSTIAAQQERFVDAATAAAFLSITRRQLLSMARSGAIPAYPASLGSRRKQWRFRLSELAEAITEGVKKPVSEDANRMDNGLRQSRSSQKGTS
jgi:hypothetical protein